MAVQGFGTPSIETEYKNVHGSSGTFANGPSSMPKYGNFKNLPVSRKRWTLNKNKLNLDPFV